MKSGEPWKREFRGKKPCCAQPHGANLKQPRCKSKRRKWEFGDLHEGRRAERLLDQENSFGKGFYCTFVQLERFSWQIVLLRVLEGALVVVRTSFEEHSTSLFERGGLLFVFEGLFLYVWKVSSRRKFFLQEYLPYSSGITFYTYFKVLRNDKWLKGFEAGQGETKRMLL